MKRGWLLALLVVAGLPIALLAFAIWGWGNSLTTVVNRGQETASLSVRVEPRGAPWAFDLPAGRRISRISDLGEGLLVVDCGDSAGHAVTPGTYVPGGSNRVSITVDGCSSVTVDVELLP